MPCNFVKPYRRLEARARIEQMIRRRRLWGQRLMSERELAAELGVCRWTIQGALAELEADGVIERFQGSGTFAAERSSAGQRKGLARLAVITEGHFEAGGAWHYRGEMIRGILGYAPRLRAGCTVLSLDQPEEREAVWNQRRMREFSGFISIALDQRELLSRLLTLRRGPVVLVDHYVRDLPIIGVVDGSFEGARAVAKHLLAVGHRRIAFINCHNPSATNPEKFAGFRAALRDRGLEADPALVAEPAEPVAGEALDRFVAAAVDLWLKLPDPPTAVFGFDDSRALAAVRALEARGRQVGRDFSVAGFGDSAIRRGLCDWLTSCRIYPRKMGQEAVRAALAGNGQGGGRTIIVPNRLYIRKSTCPPPGTV